MTTILGIDPGNDTGYACFAEGELLKFRLGDPRDSELAFLEMLVVIECPRIYPHGGKGNPNDLIKLAVMVGEYKEYFASRGSLVELVAPSAWKGQTPKDVTRQRVLKAFPWVEGELAEYPASKRHNVYDAIGIGMWACSRYDK